MDDNQQAGDAWLQVDEYRIVWGRTADGGPAYEIRSFDVIGGVRHHVFARGILVADFTGPIGTAKRLAVDHRLGEVVALREIYAAAKNGVETIDYERRRLAAYRDQQERVLEAAEAQLKRLKETSR